MPARGPLAATTSHILADALHLQLSIKSDLLQLLREGLEEGKNTFTTVVSQVEAAP